MSELYGRWIYLNKAGIIKSIMCTKNTDGMPFSSIQAKFA